jgi:hypothetical protein
MVQSGYGHMGGYNGGGGFLILNQGNQKGGYYQPPLVVPIPPLYGQNSHGIYGPSTTTTTQAPATAADVPSATETSADDNRDDHSVILISPSKAKASVSVAGRKFRSHGPSKGKAARLRPSYSLQHTAGRPYDLDVRDEAASSSGSGFGSYSPPGRKFSGHFPIFHIAYQIKCDCLVTAKH